MDRVPRPPQLPERLSIKRAASRHTRGFQWLLHRSRRPRGPGSSICAALAIIADIGIVAKLCEPIATVDLEPDDRAGAIFDAPSLQTGTAATLGAGAGTRREKGRDGEPPNSLTLISAVRRPSALARSHTPSNPQCLRGIRDLGLCSHLPCRRSWVRIPSSALKIVQSRGVVVWTGNCPSLMARLEVWITARSTTGSQSMTQTPHPRRFTRT
jgi:hypothetical protein